MLNSNRRESEILDLYMKYLQEISLLRRKEEVKLAKRIEKGQEAKKLLAEKKDSGKDLFPREESRLTRIIEAGKKAFQHLITANLRFVVYLAKKYRKRSLNLTFLGLIQEGNFGLVHAARKFNWRLGNKFTTYAEDWICRYLNEAIKNDLRRTTSLGDRIFEFDDSRESDDKTPDKRMIPSGDHIDSNSLKDVLNKMMSILSPKERTILSLRYGLEGEIPYTLNEIGEKLGITTSIVKQWQKRALHRLREQNKGRFE